MNQRDHALSTALGALRHYRTKRASVTSSNYHLMQLATYTAVQLHNNRQSDKSDSVRQT